MKVTQSCPTLCDPMDYIAHGILQAIILEWVAFSFSRGSSKPRIEPRSPALQVDSSPAEPQESGSVSRSVVPDSLWPRGLQPTKLLCPWDFPGKDTGVGSHFLLQGILPIHVSYTAGRFFTYWATRKPIREAQKWIASGNSPYDTESSTHALRQPGEVGGEREVQEGGDMCIPMADSCWWQKPTQHCKAIILQLKIN